MHSGTDPSVLAEAESLRDAERPQPEPNGDGGNNAHNGDSPLCETNLIIVFS
jgi:hypothetical protein